MKICFIYPTFHNWEAWPPLTLACLASFLEQHGHKVDILDRNVLLLKMGNFSGVDREMQRLLQEIAPEIVGITATTPLIPDAFRCAKIAKETVPKSKIILGGIHASILPELCLEECDALDFVCKGEGEFTLKELAEGRDVRQIKGLYFREDGRVKSTAPRELYPNLDDFPPPARHLLDMKIYLKPSSWMIRGLELSATHLFAGIGCIANCHFCAWPGMHGRKMRLHSADYVFKEIKHLVDDYGVEGLYLAEEMFLCNKKRTFELCNLLITSGYNKRVKLCVNLRVDVVDEEKLQLLKKAGFIQVEYGIESGSQRILDAMNKHTTVEQNQKAIALTKKIGIRTLANIIIGIPGEEKSDILKTIKLLDSTKSDYIAVNRFVPFPGSHLFNVLKDQGKISYNWTNYWCTDIETNYSNIDDKEFVKLFLIMRAKYQVKNALSSLKWNIGMKPYYILKFPYYLLKDPVNFVFRRINRKIRDTH